MRSILISDDRFRASRHFSEIVMPYRTTLTIFGQEARCRYPINY